MNGPQFTDGFLRIAARTKDIGTRKSPRFERRYTGAKGIGRLAAHKLAKFLQIESISWKVDGSPTGGVIATIDWDLVEQKETLDDVSDSGAISVEPFESQGAGRAGTEDHASAASKEVDEDRARTIPRGGAEF